MVRGIAGILPEFHSGDPAPVQTLAEVFSSRAAGEQRAAIIADAETRGYRQGLAVAREEHEAALVEARCDWERRLAEERARWAEEEGRAVAERHVAVLGQIESAIAEHVCAILLPIAGAALAQKAARELSATLRTLFSQGRQPMVTLRGPEDLLGMIRAELGELAGGIQFIPDSLPDVRLVSADTLIETQLQDWERRLAGAVDEASDE